MRDYQTKQNKGALPDSITTEKFGAGEFNSIAQELENAVSRSGQTLAPADGTGEVFTQLAESEFLHGVKSQSFQDGGTANTYQLTPISGASGVKIPADYTNLDGAVVTFTPGNASTGASTLDIGQTLGTLLGPKTLLNNDGSAIASGDIGTDPVEVRYDASADGGSGAWLLQPWSTPSENTDAFALQLLHIQEQQSTGVNAAQLGTTAFTPILVNTVLTNQITGSSLGSNQITLPAGDYLVMITCPYTPASNNVAQTRLQNITDASTELLGQSVLGNNVSGMQSSITGRFTIGASKVFEVQMYINSSSDRPGKASSRGPNEIYTDVMIWKVG